MKKFLLFISLASSILLSAQSDSLTTEYLKIVKEYKNLGVYDENIETAIKCVEKFPSIYGKILDLNDLSNVAIQKAIVQDYATECRSAINDKNDNSYSFKVGFKTKSDFEKYIATVDIILKSTTYIKILELMISEDDKYLKRQDAYIRKNLIRLNIPYSDFEKLSINDKQILFKTFK